MTNHPKESKKFCFFEVVINFNRSDFVLVSKDVQKSKLEGAIDFGSYRFKSTEPYDSSETNHCRCLLIGQVYSSLEPKWGRAEICNYLARASGRDGFIRSTHHLTGRFLTVFSIDGETYVMSDAMGQFEVYFNDDCSVIASSPNLMGSQMKLENHTGEMADLYSQIAKTTCIQIGTTTKFRRVRHLMPNHLIDVNQKSQVRFYPTKEQFNTTLDLNEAAKTLASEMRNFAKSIKKVSRLAMPVTGGNDSRILLGAFKGVNFKTFVFDHPDSNRAKKDIALAKRVLKTQDRELEIIFYKKELDQAGKKFYDGKAVVPRDESKTYIWNAYQKYLSNHVILFGHGGEVGRSFLKNIKNVNAKKLAVLMSFPGNKTVEEEMQKWLDELHPSILDSENLMDLFYWEQRMGNWGARILTEISYVTNIFSPMNARSILETMLLVPKKHRQFAGNDLAKKLITHLDRSLLSVPINPSLKYRIFWCMIRLRVYDLYQNLRLNLIVKRS